MSNDTSQNSITSNDTNPNSITPNDTNPNSMTPNDTNPNSITPNDTSPNSITLSSLLRRQEIFKRFKFTLACVQRLRSRAGVVVKLST